MGGLLSGLGRFLLGAAIGAAIGAAAGALYAPARGDDLKRQLVQRLNDIRAAGDQAERAQVETLRLSFRQHIEKRQK